MDPFTVKAIFATITGAVAVVAKKVKDAFYKSSQHTRQIELANLQSQSNQENTLLQGQFKQKHLELQGKIDILKAQQQAQINKELAILNGEIQQQITLLKGEQERQLLLLKFAMEREAAEDGFKRNLENQDYNKVLTDETAVCRHARPVGRRKTRPHLRPGKSTSNVCHIVSPSNILIIGIVGTKPTCQ